MTGAEITNGSLATSDDTVVAIGSYDPCVDNYRVYCTGTVVAPRAVLTAGHCLDMPIETVSVFVGASVFAAGVWHRAAALRVHPEYDRVGYINDVGLIILEDGVSLAAATLNSSQLGPQLVGSRARVVGFGIPEEGAGDIGIRRQGTTKVDSVSATTFRVTPDPGMTCQVDSGGPVLIDDGIKELVAGVTSNGDAFCREHADNQRVDVHLQGFIQPVLDEAATGSFTAPPPPAADNCPDCTVLGCADKQRCDTDTGECVDDEPTTDWGCHTARNDQGPASLLVLLALLLLSVRRRHV